MHYLVTINVTAAVANHRVVVIYLAVTPLTSLPLSLRQPDRQPFDGWPGLVAFPSKVEQIAVEMFDVSEIWSVVGLHDHPMHVACAQTVTDSEHATYSEVVPWPHHVPVPLVEPRVIRIVDKAN